MLPAEKWMELEIIMLSEIRQKNKYHIFSLMCHLDLKDKQSKKDVNIYEGQSGGSGGG
jgi:hypothetical protein